MQALSLLLRGASAQPMIFLATAGLALVFVLLIHGASLYGEPVRDDMTAIFGNKSLLEGRVWDQKGKDHWTQVFTSPRMLTRMSWAACAKGPGKKLPVFIALLHLGNVLCHWLTSMLMWPIASAVGLNPVACVLIFAVHPLAASAAAEMSQRAALLATFFTMSAVAFALTAPSLTVLVVPCVILMVMALLSKEDALGPFALAMSRTRLGREKLAVVDDGQLAAGFSGTLDWRDRVPTAMVETLWRWPLWVVCVGQSVEHTVRRWRFRSPAFVVCVAALLGTSMGLLLYGTPALQLAVILFWLSPMPFYWFVPIKDLVVEGRIYATVVPAVLILASLFQHPFFVVPLIAVLAILAARRAFVYQDQIKFWDSAMHRDAPERVQVNLAASLVNHGEMDAALHIYSSLLAQNPDRPLVLFNVSRIIEGQSRNEYFKHIQEWDQLGKKGEAYTNYRRLMKLALEKTERAYDLCPDGNKDSIIAENRTRLRKLAKDLKVTK